MQHNWTESEALGAVESYCKIVCSAYYGLTMRDRFTISDLARMFGGKPRSYQLWSDRGVIEPLPETKMKGTGTAKAFDRRQTEIAGIVTEYHRLAGASIGSLMNLARYVELVLADHRGPFVKAARSGKGPAWLMFSPIGDHPDTGIKGLLGRGFIAPARYNPDDPMQTATSFVGINLTAVFAKIPKDDD